MNITRWGLGLLSVAGLLMSACNADAFLFCHNCCCGHHCCETHICCRPYNAFTPICWGNIHCDGCCMSPCNMCQGYMSMMPGNPCAAGPMACLPFGCGPATCGAGGCGVPPMGPGMPPPGMAPVAPMPVGAPVPQAAPPGMNPNMPPIQNHTAQYGYPTGYEGHGLQPAGYYPGYYGYPYNPYAAYPGAYPYGAYPYGYGYNPGTN
jgi:hypothetical protein